MRLLPAVAVALLFASACSGGSEESVSPADAPSEVLALDVTTSTTAATTTSSTSTTVASTTDDATTDEATTDKATTDSEDGSSPSVDGAPTGSGIGADAPSGGGGASDDMMAAYTGALGTYSVDQVLFGAPFASPTVAPGVAPLTGLPSARSGHSAIVVKIDNSPSARPQAGIERADVVIEQEVEGGYTRLAAIFQSQTADRIGPVRSARTTDIAFLSSLGQPGLAYSGANQIVDTLIVQQSRVRNYSAARFGGYWRDSSRSAPSNLFTGISQFSTQATAPPAWFHFADEPVEAGTPVASLTATFPSTSVSWTWAGEAWQRAQDGRAHSSESGGAVQATNVIVAEVPTVDSGLRDSTGAVAVEQIWVGQGRVAVFSNGRRIDGTWVRPTLGHPALLVAADGTPIEIEPGTTWIELVRALPS